MSYNCRPILVTQHVYSRNQGRLEVKKLDERARLPYQEYPNQFSDLFLLEDLTLETNERRLVSLGIAVKVVDPFYGEIIPCLGRAVFGIDVVADLIPGEEWTEIGVLVINNSGTQQVIRGCAPIARLKLNQITDHDIVEVKGDSEEGRCDS